LLIYRKPVVLRLPQQLPVLGVGERGDGAVPEPVEHVPEQLPVAVHEHGPILGGGEAVGGGAGERGGEERPGIPLRERVRRRLVPAAPCIGGGLA
jgi:hypothetical protein